MRTRYLAPFGASLPAPLAVLLTALPLLLFLAAPAAAGSSASETLPGQQAAPAIDVPSAYEAVLLALEHNRGVLAAKRQLEQAAATEATARAALGWRLDTVAGYRFVDDVQTVADPSSSISIPVTQSYQAHTPHLTLSVRRSLFPGGSTRLDLDSAARSRTIAQLEVESALRSTALAAYEAYRRLEAALLQHQVALAARQLARSRLEVAESQHREGTGTALAVAEARLALQESESRAASAGRMLDLAAKQLSQLLNLEEELRAADLPTPSLDEVRDQIAARAGRYWPEAPALESRLDELVSLAGERRLEVLKAQEHAAMARNEVARVAVESRPRLSAELNYAWNELTSAKLTVDDSGLLSLQATTLQPYDHSTGDAIPAKKEPSWNVSVQLVWNLWDSGVEALSRRRAESAAALAETGVEQARSGVALEVQQRHSELVAAREALLAASERALIALASYDLELEKARAGIGTGILLEAAKVQRDSALAAAYAARVDYELALLHLANSAALPLEELLSLVKSLPGAGSDE